MDAEFLTKWFGSAGAIFAVLFAAFKVIWPEIKEQIKIRTEIKREELSLKKEEQENTRNIISAVKITNELVAKNNDAFNRHNAIFDLHIEAVRELRDQQRLMTGEMSRRFDNVEDKLDNNLGNIIKIEEKHGAILANLRRLHGDNRFPEEHEKGDKPSGN